MKHIWQSIETKLAELAPDILNALHPGINDDDLTALEKLIDARLPADFVEFCKVHNGQESDSPGLFFCEEFLSFDRIAREWKIWKELLDKKDFERNGEPITSRPHKGIKNNWWNPLWIPITYDGSGNHYCLDLDPAAGGSYGQIIRMWHDDTERSLEASSFTEWITKFKNDLESGELLYSEDYYGITHKDDV